MNSVSAGSNIENQLEAQRTARVLEEGKAVISSAKSQAEVMQALLKLKTEAVVSASKDFLALRDFMPHVLDKLPRRQIGNTSSTNGDDTNNEWHQNNRSILTSRIRQIEEDPEKTAEQARRCVKPLHYVQSHESLTYEFLTRMQNEVETLQQDLLELSRQIKELEELSASTLKLPEKNRELLREKVIALSKLIIFER